MSANFEKLLDSPDKDAIYLTCSIIRNDNSITSKIKNKLFKKVSVFDRIRNYSDVCEELGVKELTIEDFSFLPENHRRKALAQHKIQNICNFFNGDHKFNWSDSYERKWYPYFIKNVSGWSFGGCYFYGVYSSGEVGYYKDEKTAKFCGTTFLDIYIDTIE